MFRKFSDGLPRNNQDTTVKLYHLPPPWSSAQLGTAKPPCTQQTDSAGVVLKRSLIKHPDWHKLPSYSCSSTAAVLEWTRSPFRLNQNQTLKVCSIQPWWYHPVPHRQKGSVTYSTSAEGWLTTGQGWQRFRERKIFWNCFLKDKGESFNRV